MEKHITLVGILNLVYRSLTLIFAIILIFLGNVFVRLIESLIQEGYIQPHEVPIHIFEFIPLILLVISVIIIFISALGIAGAIGVLNKKPWARILLLVISFFNLVRIPLGTLLGGYSIWVLMNDETIKLFTPDRQNPVVSV